MGNLFGTTNKTTTNSTNSSTNSGQTNSNFMPQLQEAYSALQRQYSNLGDMGANPWQTGAADAQMGVAGNLQPAYSAAGQVAQGGIGDVSRYMSPYISNVVDATRADFAAQNARDLSNVGAQAAKLGSVTGTGRTGALLQAKESQRRTQDPVIASLYNQGFAQSGQLAQADAASRISGANSIGSLTGVNTQANLGLGALGQQAQQSNLAPYTLANQYAGATAGLAGQAGTNYTGQSSGQTNSTQTQQQNQGIGTIAAGLLGSALMGGFNPLSFLNAKPAGGAAQGGGGMASGGAVKDSNGDGIMDRYQTTLATLHRMHGGSIPGLQAFQDGGRPKFQDPNDNDPGVQNVTSMPQVGMPYSAPQPEPPRMDLGGPRSQPEASSGYDFSGLIPTFRGGVWDGEKPTGPQTLGYALTQVGKDNPFAGFGSAAFGQYNKEEERRRQRDELAKRLAMDSQRLAQERALATGIGVDGKPTVSLQQLQEMVRHHQAQEGQTRFSPLPEKSRGVLDTKTGQITAAPTEDRAQDRFNESYAKEHAPKNYDQAVANYATAAESAETFRALSDLAPYAKTGYTGPIPPEAMLTARKMAASIGLANPDSIGPTELFKFLSQKGVFGITSQLKPASNLDVLMAEKATASMQSDPSTLPLALPVLKRIEERKMLYQEGMMNFFRRGVAASPEEIKELVRSIDKRLPLVDMSGQAGAIDGPAGGQRVNKPVTDRLGQPGQAQPEAPPQAQGWTPEDLAAARPGQKTPNGKLIMGRDGKLHPVTGPAGSETNPHEIGLFSGPTLRDGEYAVWNGKLYQQRGSGFGSLVPVERQ